MRPCDTRALARALRPRNLDPMLGSFRSWPLLLAGSLLVACTQVSWSEPRSCSKVTVWVIGASVGLVSSTSVRSTGADWSAV